MSLRILVRLTAIFLICNVTASGFAFADDPPGQLKRLPWTTSRLSGTPDPPPPYQVELAFPHLKFSRPLDMADAPGSQRLFVAEQGGKIVSFLDDPGTDKSDVVIDLKQVYKNLTAVYGLTFHPKFEQNRYVYICYVLGNDQPDATFVSRFNMSRSEPPTIDAATEKVLVRWWSGGHNGGSLKFGPDGYFYISTGDGGAPDPPDPLHVGQDVSNLLSSILRIDVDQQDGELPYRIPADNPLVGLPDTRPEIWAYGFRNPWRMSFDRERGDLWVGDVGWQLWEMVYRVEKGGNYGWPIVEASQSVLPDTKPGPTPILPPTVAHPHSEAASITGGYVYYGTSLPELRGAYIYGDYQTGKIWGLRHDGKQVTWHEALASSPLQLVAFGQNREGELYLLDHERSMQIFRLTKNPETSQQQDFPRRLSQTGLFSSTKDQSPQQGVVAYSINVEPWADHATAERWFAIPGSAPITMKPNVNWEFPDGSVIAKTVSMEMDRGNLSSKRKLETQILHREDGSWRPYSYAWNDDQFDASLVDAAGENRTLTITDKAVTGGSLEVNYRIAGRAECQLCHNPWVEKKTTSFGVQTASVLGLSVAQLNRAWSAGGSTVNQLAALHQAGYLAGELPKDFSSAPRFPSPTDPAVDLDSRVRSYLHVNCAHCHTRHSGGTATIELVNDVKLEDAKLLDVRPAQGAFGISGAKLIAPGDPFGSVLLYRVSKLGGGRMPRLGSELVDEQSVSMIHDWIASLPRTSDAQTVATLGDANEKHLDAIGSKSADERRAAIVQLLSSTRSSMALLQRVQADNFPTEVREEIVARAAAHAQAEVRDLFERFVPPSQRVKRLGTAVDLDQLLALPADAERGRQLFFRDGAATCKSCHRLSNLGENLGPDLSQIGKKYPPKEMLTHLLEPSKFIEPKYVPYLLETSGGQIVSGLLIEKNENEVVMRNNQNQEVRTPLAEVEQLVPSPKSLMPELLLRDMTPQEAADLLAYLCSLK